MKMQTFPNFYSSGYHCVRDTLKEEGMRGLYNGAVPAMAAQVHNNISPLFVQMLLVLSNLVRI